MRARWSRAGRGWLQLPALQGGRRVFPGRWPEPQEGQLPAWTRVFPAGHPQTLTMLLCASPPQRAKIGQAPKTPEEKTTNTTSTCDSNGSGDRVKLTDFNFLMVLGKGSFGKVRHGSVAAPAPEGAAPGADSIAVRTRRPRPRGETQG